MTIHLPYTLFNVHETSKKKVLFSFEGNEIMISTKTQMNLGDTISEISQPQKDSYCKS